MLLVLIKKILVFMLTYGYMIKEKHKVDKLTDQNIDNTTGSFLSTGSNWVDNDQNTLQSYSC